MRLHIAPERRKLRLVTNDQDQRILIVDSDAQFREGLYNFLLAAGYEQVDAAGSFTNALEKIRKSAYDVVVSEAGSRLMEGFAFAERIMKANPELKLILMIKVEDQENWTEKAGSTGFQFLLKPTFPQNLLYLLQNQG
jgi:DNA-binding NtrC family response regulator